MAHYCACSDAVRAKFGTSQEGDSTVCANCGLPIAAATPDSSESDDSQGGGAVELVEVARDEGGRRSSGPSQAAIARQQLAQQVFDRARLTERLGAIVIGFGIAGIFLAWILGLSVMAASSSADAASFVVGLAIALEGTLVGILLCLVGAYARMRGSKARLELLLNARRPSK